MPVAKHEGSSQPLSRTMSGQIFEQAQEGAFAVVESHEVDVGEDARVTDAPQFRIHISPAHGDASVGAKAFHGLSQAQRADQAARNGTVRQTRSGSMRSSCSRRQSISSSAVKSGGACSASSMGPKEAVDCSRPSA
ncbi:MAG: hypothetical protein U0361_05070 [Nitrospiraceae bacterium]